MRRPIDALQVSLGVALALGISSGLGAWLGAGPSQSLPSLLLTLVRYAPVLMASWPSIAWHIWLHNLAVVTAAGLFTFLTGGWGGPPVLFSFGLVFGAALRAQPSWPVGGFVALEAASALMAVSWAARLARGPALPVWGIPSRKWTALLPAGLLALGAACEAALISGGVLR